MKGVAQLQAAISCGGAQDVTMWSHGVMSLAVCWFATPSTLGVLEERCLRRSPTRLDGCWSVSC